MSALEPDREEYIRENAAESTVVPSVHVNELMREIKRLRAELAVAQTEAASARESADTIRAMKINAVREQVKKTIASGLMTSQSGIVWDEAICERVAQKGPLALVAYAQHHIGTTLWMQTQTHRN